MLSLRSRVSIVRKFCVVHVMLLIGFMCSRSADIMSRDVSDDMRCSCIVDGCGDT